MPSPLEDQPPVPKDRDARPAAPAAPSRLVNEHGARVYAMCARLAPDPEDCYQEIWEKVLGALGRFDPRGPASIGTWIATIARRHLVDRHRRRTVRGEVVPIAGLPTVDPGADEVLAGRQRRDRVEAAVQRLPEAHRRVVVLHHVHGVSLEDLAAEEGVPVGTIKSRLHRGRIRLAELLGGEA
jgi:RNA polymerase sigma-70 factor, ECF subfamily